MIDFHVNFLRSGSIKLYMLIEIDIVLFFKDVRPDMHACMHPKWAALQNDSTEVSTLNAYIYMYISALRSVFNSRVQKSIINVEKSQKSVRHPATTTTCSEPLQN